MLPSKAVILPAVGQPAGAGARPLPRGEHSPALLFPVANRSLLDHALAWLDDAGVQEVAVMTPPGLERAAREAVSGAERGFRLRWLERPCRGGGGRDALDEFLAGEPFVLHLADSLSRQALRSLELPEPVGRSQALLLVNELPPGGGAVVDLRSRRSGSPYADRCAPAGVAVLGAEAVGALEAATIAPGQELERLADRIERDGGEVSTRRVDGWWRFGHGPDTLLDGNRFALEALRPDYRTATLTDTNVQGAVVVHRSAVLESSVVRGPAIIGPRARLLNAYVGPYSSIGADVVVEGAELEYSIVFPGARIEHLGLRLEASVIGARARVGREFRIPRALRLDLGPGAEVLIG